MDWTRDRRLTLSAPPALIWPAVLFLIATAILAIVRAAVEFEKGIWLIAFLLLVGFVAQIVAAVGQSAIRTGRTPSSSVVAESLLWNAGSVLVPIGALTGGKAGVILGSLALIAALVLFGRSVSGPEVRRGTLRALYLLFVVFMAASVATGIGLSWSQPWF